MAEGRMRGTRLTVQPCLSPELEKEVPTGVVAYLEVPSPYLLRDRTLHTYTKVGTPIPSVPSHPSSVSNALTSFQAPEPIAVSALHRRFQQLMFLNCAVFHPGNTESTSTESSGRLQSTFLKLGKLSIGTEYGLGQR